MEVYVRRYRKALVDCYDLTQFAYRLHSSTVCTLVHFHDIIFKFLGMPDVVAQRILCFEMTRAFECIPHNLLLSRISDFPLSYVSTLVNWQNSYLSERKN